MIGLRPVALFGVPALVVVGALTFWLNGGRYATTENAFVKADIAQIARKRRNSRSISTASSAD